MEQAKVTLANIEAQIAAWLREKSGSGNEALISEMIRTIVKLVGMELAAAILKFSTAPLKELRHAFSKFSRPIAQCAR